MGASIVVDREERCQLMVEVGDRIRLSSMKGPGREGLVTAVTGSLVRVRWLSGEETMVAPAPGTLSVLAAGRAVPQKGAKKSAAKKHGRRDEEEHRQQERAAQEERGEEDQGVVASVALIGRGKWSAVARFGDPRSLIWWVPSGG